MTASYHPHATSVDVEEIVWELKDKARQWHVYVPHYGPNGIEGFVFRQLVSWGSWEFTTTLYYFSPEDTDTDPHPHECWISSVPVPHPDIRYDLDAWTALAEAFLDGDPSPDPWR